MLSLAHLFASISGLVVAFAACQRVPEEPHARPQATGNAAPIEPKRCIHATPTAPPPAVAKGPAPGCPADPAGGPPKLPVVALAFPEAGDIKIEAELARAPEELQRGLMYRKAMADDRGMLFRMADRSDHNFWMRNTCIPLDMFFVDDDGVIVGILENVPTLNEESRGVGCPSSWILEMNAGWARKHGVRAGQKLTIPASAR